jgi:hypothetical protein
MQCVTLVQDFPVDCSLILLHEYDTVHSIPDWAMHMPYIHGQNTIYSMLPRIKYVLLISDTIHCQKI